jgi:hypothetical protein
MFGSSFIDPHDPEGALVSFFRHLYRRLQARRVRNWPVIKANIRVAILEEITGEQGGHIGWQCRIIYDYTVQGTKYAGRAYGPVWVYDRQAAEEIANNLPGAGLPVRYKPGNPAESTYLPSDGGPPQLLLAEPDPKTGLVILSLK